MRSGANYRVVARAGERVTTSTATTVVVTQHPSSVQIAGAKVRPGKQVVVTVRSSVDGVAEVAVKRGTKVLKKVVVVKADQSVAVRLGALPKKGKGNATVTVAVTPAGLDHAPATVSKKVAVRK